MKFTVEYHTRWGENLVLRSAGKSWPMSYVPDGKWSVELPAEEFFDGEAEREYFYEVVCDGLSTRHEWRLHSLKAAEKREEILDSWSDSPGWKGAGTAIPVFALRSEDDFGVGEFLDLKKMVDWAVLTGQTFLQLLPVNDTTMFGTIDDSYPYNANSTFALHPQFINLPAAGVPVDKEYLKLQKQLNSFVKDGRPETDYVSVNREKRRLLRKAFDANWKSLSRTKAYRNFLAANREWLIPYSRFCALRDEFGTPDFSQWGEFAVYDEARLERWNKSHRSETDFNCFLQFHLDAQFRQVRDYAHSKGVVLKGDLPIGVSRTSADAWQFSKLFNMDSQAGAPPDSFSTNGQNWGFPTYNWDEMLKDGCQWWTRRFTNMSKYFDAYRIDHVLGFFRIWEIPVHSVHGLLGQFQPSLGLTVAEIERYGLHWDEGFMTKPFITDWVLDRWFGEKSGYVRETFLNHTHDDCYEMKPEFDTQRKVEAYFNAKADSNGLEKDDTEMRDTLYALISNVLFLRDHKDKNKFHPRISSQLDPCYETLWDKDKNSYNTLYNDYFYRRNNQYWYCEAMKKLPRLIDATRMLVCAEDLGMVPDCVPWVMNELKILSLEIQNMPKETNLRFGNLSHNPYRSVCTISSHDTATMRMWWDEDWEQAQAYYRDCLYRGDAAPHPMPGWLARDIIFRHLACPSMLCILTLQDWLATDEKLRLADAEAERINIPANPKHYWRYRMHLNLEDLLAADDFTHTLQGMIKETQR